MQSRVLKDSAIEMNETLTRLAATTTSWKCGMRAHEIGADLPLLRIIWNLAKEEERAEAGTKLAFIELDTSGPFI